MTNSEAIEILIEHNAWRSGEGKYAAEFPPVAPPHTPKEIGKAIDCTILALKG